ncbi:MAG TPA: phosphatase PAP2 family protein [Candidatus Dormibacteraeota bacterium]|nr:phosphatase PAP2 family protein [Candidatus Dormibacteraeota bacterium]
MASLTPRFFGIAILGAAFIALTLAISAGLFTALDHQVASAMHDVWQPRLHGAFQAVAELGGVELTTILLAGLAFYLWQEGFGTDALAVLVFVAAEAFEAFYRYSFYHPGPPRSISQADGPSISELLGRSLGGNSFPSGHMLRTVITYGLIAFVIRRLSPSPRVRMLAVIGAVAIIVLMAFDRLYLDVHWESDVVGGLLLGAIALLAGTVWLDRPRRPRRPQN